MKRSIASIAAAAACALATTSARADTLNPGGRDVGKISEISKGVKELGIESLFLLNYSKVGNGGASALRATVLGSLAFRYFIANNLALTLNVGGLYRTFDAEGKGTDVAGTAILGAAYYVSLGGGMFIAPSVGLGGLYGGRKTEAGPVTVRETVVGGLGRAGLGLVFYPSSRVNLFARPEVTAVYGSSKPSELPAGVTASASSFFSVDGGFSVGASYIF